MPRVDKKESWPGVGMVGGGGENSHDSPVEGISSLLPSLSEQCQIYIQVHGFIALLCCALFISLSPLGTKGIRGL